MTFVELHTISRQKPNSTRTTGKAEALQNQGKAKQSKAAKQNQQTTHLSMSRENTQNQSDTDMPVAAQTSGAEDRVLSSAQAFIRQNTGDPVLFVQNAGAVVVLFVSR